MKKLSVSGGFLHHHYCFVSYLKTKKVPLGFLHFIIKRTKKTLPQTTLF